MYKVEVKLETSKGEKTTDAITVEVSTMEDVLRDILSKRDLSLVTELKVSKITP